MSGYTIKKMESIEEIVGKGYVHYKSWHETYTGLVDAGYMERITLEKYTESSEENAVGKALSRADAMMYTNKTHKAPVEGEKQKSIG